MVLILVKTYIENSFMKQKFLIFGALLSFMLLTFSCSSEPNDEVLVGTYSGAVGYKKEGKNIAVDNGSVTVVRRGNIFSFTFSDGIPALDGISMIERGNGGYILKDAELGSNTISISSSGRLELLYISDKETWMAHCKK